MCGIYGFSLKPGANIQVAMWKFKMLGLYNIDRGKDSCGVFIDGQIIKGVDDRKLFSRFIEHKPLPYPKDNLVVIGHNRASTRGLNTEKNAHPFLINDNLVGVHNGTLQDTYQLCQKYGLKWADFDVDSHMLYTIIEKDGLDVLNHYKGAAALAYTYKNDPNVLYLYHGASRNTKGGEIIEERPLCYVETEDGLFFSSLAESLFAIRDTEDQTVWELQNNVVIQVQNGEITDTEHYVDREDTNITVVTSYGHHRGKASQASSKVSGINLTKTKDTGVGISNFISKDAPDELEKYPNVICRETLPMKVTMEYNKDEKFIYQHCNRYWENPRTMCHGIMFIKDRGYITDSIDKKGDVYYFWEGVMLKDKEAYNFLLDMKANKSSFLNHPNNMNYASYMSKFSKYPVTNIGNQAATMNPFFRHAFYLDDKRLGTASNTPKFSGRNYAFVEGMLVNIHSSHKGEQTLHKTESEAIQEVEVFTKGGIIGTPGGSAKDSPFHGPVQFIDSGSLSYPSSHFPCASKFCPTDTEDDDFFDAGGIGYAISEEARESSSNRYEESDSIEHSIGENSNSGEDGAEKFFYELVFKDLEEALQNMGELEISALKKLCKKYLDKTYPLPADDAEVENAVNDIILGAVNSKSTLLEVCMDDEEKEDLIAFYDENLRDLTSGTPEDDEEEEDDDEAPNDKALIEKYEAEVTEILDTLNNLTAMNIAGVKQTFERLKDMRGQADELSAQEDDYSQDVAFGIYNSVDASLINIMDLANKYGDKDLAGQIKQYIKEPGARI